MSYERCLCNPVPSHSLEHCVPNWMEFWWECECFFAEDFAEVCFDTRPRKGYGVCQ
jgi:hypothetical protein